MAIFAIADLHLSFGVQKPMDIFKGWENYTERLHENWQKYINKDDTVVIAGDISWATSFDELYPDLKFINELNGQKIISKGNHDYWWQTALKLKKFCADNNFDTISFLHNNSYFCEGLNLCGTRGWMFDDYLKPEDEKILNREALRLKASLDSAQNDGEKIVFLHYPPIAGSNVCRQILDILHEYGIKRCYYGHLHNLKGRELFDMQYEGIIFNLISSDYINFEPVFVPKGL